MTTRSVVDGQPNGAVGAGALPALPPRLSTAEHAASVVRAQIASGALLPGTRLREEEVAESFAISRNTVREVFRLLAHERLVEHVAYRGVHIRRLRPGDISAMYLTRRLVEPLGIRAVVADPDIGPAGLVIHRNRPAVLVIESTVGVIPGIAQHLPDDVERLLVAFDP